MRRFAASSLATQRNAEARVERTGEMPPLAVVPFNLFTGQRKANAPLGGYAGVNAVFHRQRVGDLVSRLRIGGFGTWVALVTGVVPRSKRGALHRSMVDPKPGLFQEEKESHG